MKKILSMFLVCIAVFSVCTPAFAADSAQMDIYTIVVNGRSIDLDDLPVPPYREGTAVMVPLRKVGEALGYQVDWNSKTKAITVDDGYIQKATLFDGTTAVIYEGRLQVIDMDRKVENQVPTVIHDGYTYVPLRFFEDFFNDTGIDGAVITVTTSMSELQATIE